MDKAQYLSRMMRLCSMSEHCISDISAKLTGDAQPFREEIIAKLCKEGYIDESRYARAFARDKSSLQGWGSAKIRLALQRKGIDGQCMAEALASIDEEASDAKLQTLLTAKLKSLSGETDNRKKMAKLYRFALGRGYGYDQINKVLNNINS